MVDLKDFSSLVDSYYAKVYYHCVKTIKNNHDSADITQNTFTKAFINIKNLKKPDSNTCYFKLNIISCYQECVKDLTH